MGRSLNGMRRLTRAEVSEWFARNVEAEFHKFNPQTGLFMEGEGWAVTCQDIMLSMAIVYLQDFPGNRLYQDPTLLEMIGQTGDGLRNVQYPDGKVEFVKVDGSKWGPIYMPWSMYHWLETYHLLASELDEGRKASWQEGLLLAFEGIHKEMQESLGNRSAADQVVHNIPTWNAMALNRAATVFNQPNWKQTADTMIQLTLEVQHEDGFWPEYHGPTTLYNLVYTHALGLYHHHNGGIDVLPALERALRFHEHFTYPDGSRVETIDGRTKYDTNPSPMGLVGLTLSPGGESYAQSMIRLAMERGVQWKAPHMAQLLQYWKADDDSSAADQAATLFDEPALEAELASCNVIKQQGWYVCLSGFSAHQVESRWGQDRQSFIGVWNELTGLIIGGGNSKNQPEWSTFELRTAEGEHYYVPHTGAVHASNHEIQLTCGPLTLTTRLIKLEANRVQLEFVADVADGDYGVVHLPIQLLLNSPLIFNDEAGTRITEQALQRKEEQGSHTIRHGSWQLCIEGAYRLDWPSYPFNPYAGDGAAHLEEAVAILTLPLMEGRSRRLSLQIT
ncbi:MAG: hypothetical protein K0R67_1466 [Paenibacillus sp.]|nr:hypothetical protein [Paenibacillus sp.]